MAKFLLSTFLLINVNFLIADSEGPVLSNFIVSPSTIDVTEGDVTITFFIDATDETGVTTTYRPSINNAATNAGGPAANNWELISGTNQDGTWQATMTIPSTQGASEWYLYSQSFEDIYGYSSALETDGTGGADNGGLTVINSNSESNAPVLSNLTVSPDTVYTLDGDTVITFTIDATDETGVTTTYRPSIINAETGAGGPAAEDWELVSGTTQDGTWQATMTIPETQGASTWYLYSQSFEDSFTNSAALETDNRGGKRFGGLTVINDDQNSAPKIKSTSFDVDENTTDIGTLDVSDRDGDELTFAITGPKIISVDSKTGELTFNNAPNYENRSAYSIKVFVSDGEETSTKRIAINYMMYGINE